MIVDWQIYYDATVALGSQTASQIDTLELTIGLTAIAGGLLALFSLGTSAVAAEAAIDLDVAATADAIQTAYQGSQMARVIGLTSLAVGAVGVIDAFHALPIVSSLFRDSAPPAGIRGSMSDDISYQTLEQIDGTVWPDPPSDATRLIRTVVAVLNISDGNWIKNPAAARRLRGVLEQLRQRDDLEIYLPPDDEIWSRIDELRASGILQ
jgi:hypothetical protein